MQYNFLPKINLLILNNSIIFIKIYLSKIYFYKNEINKLAFLFLNKYNYITILKQFLYFYKNYFKFYFFKVRLRGLGYRIRRMTKNLYRFFFGINHYFYLHWIPDIFLKHYRRNLIVISHNKIKLNDIFAHLLLLKKLDFYERNNSFIISKKILFLKKRK